jgi:regulator of sigma E protease
MTLQLILEFVAALAFLIIVHELGHFIACRIFKVDVEEFGIGLPPRLLTLFESGGTRFTLNWLPLGGFVRPKGDNDPAVPGGLAAANPWARIVILLAGSTMNLLTGVILFVLMFSLYGDPAITPGRVQIMGVNSGSPAEEAGLLACDLLVAIDDQPVNDFETLQQAVAASGGAPLRLTYQRGGDQATVLVTPRLQPPDDRLALGVLISYPVHFEPINGTSLLPLSASLVASTGYEMLKIPVRLLTRDIPAEEGRPVGIKGMYDIYEAVRTGDLLACTPRLFNVMNFLAAITISLGVLNLLPIPALDGGRILFTLPEIILRRRIPPQYENMVNMIGFFLLIGLLLYVNLQDFINPVLLP